MLVQSDLPKKGISNILDTRAVFGASSVRVAKEVDAFARNGVRTEEGRILPGCPVGAVNRDFNWYKRVEGGLKGRKMFIPSSSDSRVYLDSFWGTQENSALFTAVGQSCRLATSHSAVSFRKAYSELIEFLFVF